MATTDLGSSLQHPRRSLGNRHRSQAEKFLKLSMMINQIVLGLLLVKQFTRLPHPDN